MVNFFRDCISKGHICVMSLKEKYSLSRFCHGDTLTKLKGDDKLNTEDIPLRVIEIDLEDGTKEYYKLLEKFDNLLEDYTLTTDDGEEVKVGEKRIFAPDFIYVENGVAKSITSATSEKQKDADAKLTKEILKDEEKSFDNFFKNK